MRVVHSELAGVTLVVIVRKSNAGLSQRIDYFAKKQSAVDRGYSKRTRIGVAYITREAAPLGSIDSRFDSVYSTGENRNRKNHPRIEELILVGKVPDLLVVCRDSESRVPAHLLLNTRFEHVLSVG